MCLELDDLPQSFLHVSYLNATFKLRLYCLKYKKICGIAMLPAWVQFLERVFGPWD